MSANGSGAVSDAVASIEAELKGFWAASQGEGEAKEPPKVRASTMNFVALTSPKALEKTRDAADALAATRPGRVFVLTLDAARPPWEVDASTSAVCHKEGDSIVCYDRIEIVFGAMSAQRAASVVSALALGEVPTVVEACAGAPTPLVDALAPKCDRLIVDSEHTTVARIAELAKKPGVVVADRAFVRTFSFREFVARFFDQDPSLLKAIRSVEIAVAKGGGNYAAALTIGWLASRLGWKIESRRSARSASGETIELAVRDEAAEELTPGEIWSIRIKTKLDGKDVVFDVERIAGTRAVCCRTSGAMSSEHRYPIGFRDETWVALKALESIEGDAPYREAVIAAAEWSGR